MHTNDNVIATAHKYIEDPQLARPQYPAVKLSGKQLFN